VVLGVIFLLTIVFYVWGQLESRNKDVVVELNLDDDSISEIIAGAGE